MAVANTAQLGFIKAVKDTVLKSSGAKAAGFNITTVYHPASPQLSTKLSNFYLKPVILVAPDLQYFGFKDQLRCPDCKQAVSERGWSDSHRYIHGLSTGFYILQKRYCCKTGTCERETFDALTLLEELGDHIPDFIRFSYPIVSSGKTWFHSDLATSIVSDAITGKTFDEQCQSIQSFRLQEYTNKRAAYESLRHHLSKSLAPIMDGLFSDMETYGGYNEVLCPDATTIVEFFNDYIEKYDDFMEACFDEVPISKVLKLDATFNIQDRTKVFFLFNWHWPNTLSCYNCCNSYGVVIMY